MSDTIPKPADRGEWLKARHGFFNASDAACLYGCHPFKSLADVVVEKLADGPTDNGQTEAMERGIRLEPFLLEWFADRAGCHVVAPDELFVTDRLMATLDGEIYGASDEWIEAKTTSQRWDEPPEYVRWQVVAQAAASGRKRCHVVWIDSDMAFKTTTIEPEPDEVADLLERATKFMEFIDLGMTPEGIELGADHLAKLYPVPEPAYAEVDEIGLELIREWELIRQQRLEVEKLENEAKDKVARLIADKEGASHGGVTVCTWKPVSRTRLDAKSLEADHPEICEKYRQEYTYRTLRATKGLR